MIDIAKYIICIYHRKNNIFNFLYLIGSSLVNFFLTNLNFILQIKQVQILNVHVHTLNKDRLCTSEANPLNSV